MSYKVGETVIVTQNDINRVGVVLDKFVVSKRVVYDILLENRSAVCMVCTTPNSSAFINKPLTERLCKTEIIQPTFSYQVLLQQDELPITKS